MTFEQKNENAANVTQGNFTFGAGGGRTAFQNFPERQRGRAVRQRLHLHRGARSTSPTTCASTATRCTRRTRWKPRAERHGGLRRPLLAVPADHRRQQRADELPPVGVRRRQRAEVRQRHGHADHRRHRRSAQRHHRRRQELAVRRRDLHVRQRATSSRASASTWDPKSSTAGTIFRGAYGIYYDQALVGIFEQNSFTNPPFVNTVSILNRVRLATRRGRRPRRRPACARSSATATTSRRRARSSGTSACSSSCTRAARRRQLRRLARRSPDPADRHQLPATGRRGAAAPSPARSTWRGRTGRTARSRMRETTARSNYWGMLTSFRSQRRRRRHR